MAISVVNTATDTATLFDTNSFSHDMSAGGDIAIVVVSSRQSGDTGPDTTTCTIGGESATKLSSASNSRQFYSIWYLHNPPASNNTVAVDISIPGGGNHRTGGFASYLLSSSDVNENPTLEGTYKSGASTSASVNTTISKTGNLTIGVGIQEATADISFNSGQTQVLEAQLNQDTASTHFSSYKDGLSEGSDSHGVTSNQNAEIYMAVCEIVASALGRNQVIFLD